ncbi:protein YgfX [Bergeriella denitrificans]|uniref:Transcriptional regulator n=1 Tax=Bergeriella denitrificans TaxID=494 RepID=A0A378UEK9_BERDE|nr:protein YgfX [Bergeriella denitrificans]STZ75848.1 transcriptional regulator [Bergeriella denitrificans]
MPAPAFHTALRPSRTMKSAALALHLAAAAICLVYFYGWMMWAGLAGLAFSLIHAWRVIHLQYPNAIRKIVINPQQRAAVFIGQPPAAFEAVLLGSTVISRHALFLHWDTGSRKIRQAVLPDMTDRDSYRRLRVWARWCQGKDNETPKPSEKDPVV